MKAKIGNSWMRSVLAACSLAFACFVPNAFAQSGNVYSSNQVQAISNSQEGIVLQVSIKQAAASTQVRAGGGTSGGLVGALIGSSLGGDSQTKTLLGTLGALGGAFAGERMANAAATNEAQEIVIGLKDGRSNTITRVVTVVQPAPFDTVVENDNVLVVNTNGAYRVIRRTYNTAALDSK